MANISGKGMIFKIRQVPDQPPFSPRYIGEKSPVNLGTLTTEVKSYSPKSTFSAYQISTRARE